MVRAVVTVRMPITATGRTRSKIRVQGKVQGFSLIEMLVVMTIIGLIVSVVTVSTGSLSAVFGGDDGSAESVADDLMVLMAAASSQAILSGEPMALGFTSSSTAQDAGIAVTWLRYGRVAGGSVRNRQAMWQPVSAQTGLRELSLPSVVSSELSVEGERIDAQALADNPGMPALVFYPTGESTAFHWSLVQGERVVTLTNVTTGEIERRQR